MHHPIFHIGSHQMHTDPHMYTGNTLFPIPGSLTNRIPQILQFIKDLRIGRLFG